MLSIILSIIALGFIVAFHEFGHFVAARMLGVGVIEFSVGMGPRLFSRVSKNTRYSLRAFPFGGSCMMLGEEIEESDETLHEGFTNLTTESMAVSVLESGITIDGRHYRTDEQFVKKSAWKRFVIVAAGPMFNFLLAFIFGVVITAHYGYDPPRVVAVEDGMPVAEAGMEAGDIITGMAVVGSDRSRVRFSEIETSRDVQMFIAEHEAERDSGSLFSFRYTDASQGGSEAFAFVRAAVDEESGGRLFGFTYSTAFVPAESVGEIVYYGFYDVKYCVKAALASIRMILMGAVSRSDIAGPVRMIAFMDEAVDSAADYGITAQLMSLLDLIVLISGSLGAMNLLPIPALDGGRLFFIAVEMLLRRRVPRELEWRVHMAGMSLLLMLMVLVMFNDISLLIFG